MIFKNELIINGQDAYRTWGIYLDGTSLSTLQNFAPLKTPAYNKAANRHGKQVRPEAEPRLDERDFSLVICMEARGTVDLLNKKNALEAELRKRRIEISTRHEPTKIYRCDFQSCTQFRTLYRGLAKFTLKLNEPNPHNRAVTSEETYADTDI